MNEKKTRRARLRVKKDTLRTLSTDQAAQVHGGENAGNLNASRYCLETRRP